jgi:exo-beta-1,3-glucanase (GH17 family)
MRVYASSDCNTLANAVPAAIKTGGQILASVWTQDEGHYEREKQALLTATQQHGTGWLVAVTVGSEDLYRKETPPSRLAQQIYDVRGMLSTVPMGSSIQVGHVDTWTAWVSGENIEVIQACDFIGTDGYPYFQNTQANNIDQGSNLFWESVQDVRNVVNKVKPGAWVWITEVCVSCSSNTHKNANFISRLGGLPLVLTRTKPFQVLRTRSDIGRVLHVLPLGPVILSGTHFKTFPPVPLLEFSMRTITPNTTWHVKRWIDKCF